MPGSQLCAVQSLRQFEFQLHPDAPTEVVNPLHPVINPTDEPSRILDVGQWITLFRVILEAANNESDKIESRRLGYEAAMCLEEAIKFYDDNELPPSTAAFTETTRTRLREHPEQFAKQRLVDFRAKLPTTVRMISSLSKKSETPPKKPWWKFWRSN